MKTLVKYLSDTSVELTIAVDKEALLAAEQVALTKLSRTIKAPGFRKGKVPVTVAAKYVDPNQLAEQTVDNALSKAVAEAFVTENIQALARPEVAITKFVPGSELEFTATVDVVPKIKLGNYSKLGVKAEKVVVSDADVDAVIERLRSGTAETKDVARAAKNGDTVVINFIGKKDGVAFEGGTAKNHSLEIGSNSFIPGFEEGLVGMKAGESKDLALTFPAEYHAAELAGADVVFETTLNKVQEKVLPELDDSFAKNAGYEDVKTLKDLRQRIKADIQVQKEKEALDARKDALVTKLVEVSNVAAPKVLIDDQAQSIEQDMTQNLMYQGMTIDQYVSAQGMKSKEEWLEKEVLPAAEKRVQAGLVLAELSKELKIEATDDEMHEFTDRYKAQYSNNPELVKRFDEPEVQRDLRNRLLTEKTVDALVTHND